MAPSAEAPTHTAHGRRSGALERVDFMDALWLCAVEMNALASPSSSRRPVTGFDDLAAASGPAEPQPSPDVPPPKQTPEAGAPTPPAVLATLAVTTSVMGDEKPADVAALPNSRSLAQAFRPFKRRVPSTWDTEPDEEATADRVAEERLWLAVSRPKRERWLRLALITDRSLSTVVWRPTLDAFRSLLERHGAFRDVREFVLSPRPGEGTTGLVLQGPGTLPRHPAELLDPSGRQVFVVFTDYAGETWRHPGVGRLLRLWGSSGPLAFINPFPQSYWHRSALIPRRALLHPPRRVAPNTLLRVQYPRGLRNPFDPPVGTRAMVIPVLELSPSWIAWWSSLVADPQGWTRALVHCVDPGSVADRPEPDDDPSAADLVLGFRASASPTAFRLATYFAAAPMDLPLLRQIQHTMLPDSAPFHLAEVLTSELVRHTPQHPERMQFATGVREQLLAAATRDDTARVVRVIAARQDRSGATSAALSRAITAPDQTPDLLVTSENLSEARTELAVLTALSGPYALRASRLRHAITAFEGRTNGREESFASEAHRSPNGGVQDADTDHDPERGGPMPAPMDSEDPVDRPHAADGSQRPDEPPSYDIGEQSHPGDDDPILSVQALLEGHEQEGIATVWGNVPPRNPVFTGRREMMNELEQRLSRETVAAVLPQALHGMGGVGKSQIAIEYVYRHRADYDIVWWVPSEQPAQILASLIELGNRLGLDIGLEANTAVPQVRAALHAGEPYSNWLLVFDNAETIDTVRDYLPEAGTGKVLVTSRNPAWSAIAQTLEVDVFTREESIRLLQRRNRRLDNEACDRLADALGDLPLAIEHASAWLYTTGMEVAEYLALLEQKRAELTELVSEHGYDMPIAAAANVALDRLGVENRAALQLLQVCSFFAPEPIGRDLFTGPRLTPIAPELDSALQDPRRLNQAIRDIQRYVLVRIDHRANTIQLHRLVQAVLQSGMSIDEHSKMQHGAHVLLAGGRLGAPTDTREWLRYQALASHLTASNAVVCSDDWARELILNLIEFYYYWGDYSSSLNLSQRVVTAWREMLGDDHEQTLRAAKWFGFLQRVTGDYARAAAINADSLERYRRTVGPDDEGTIDAMALVATDLRVAGRFTQARELDLDAFQRARRVFGEDDPETLKSALSLGVSLRLTGDFRTARQLDSDTYRRRRAVLGEDHPETLRILNNMTLDERECGEYLKAHLLTERLYQRYSSIFGAKHPETIEVARNLAVARRRAGDHDGAYKLSEATMNRFRELYSPVHPSAIAAALDLAVDIRESDDLLHARRMALETAELYQSALGPEHPYTLYARTNLGIVLRLLGDLDEAYRQNLVAWESLSELLGPSHLLTLTCAINLASDQAALGDHQRAYSFDSETLDRCRQVIGQEHPTTLAVALNLALDLAALGRQADSEILFARTLGVYRRVLGSDHPALVAARARVRANCDVDPMPF